MKNLYNIVFVLCVLGLFSCKKKTLFEQISSSHSGIHFNNKITESDSINPLDVVNIYNGGGVGIGDFNNDGLPDIYFTGNMVSNRLYLNKGNFEFEDITEKAGVEGMGRWGRGVAIVDINNDGLPDIYICNTIYKDSLRRRNILYVNQGVDKDGIPHFKDMAKEYGLDIVAESTMASFFDYDNDGDLDMYLTVNNASAKYNPSVFGPANTHGTIINTGRLYRNDWDSTLHHPVFHDVSQKAGINQGGYGHAATTVDFNGDGWKDIYVSDDFISDNILYINNHDGTFTNRSKEYFKHTSLNAMGQDVVDINNDGLPDVVELDMNAPDNYRKKMMLNANSYQTYQSFDLFGYQYQYIRNTLQLNQGPRVGQQGRIGSPAFSEIGFLAGMAQTDWSWTPLVVDFNNDGFRDIVITNGFRKDYSDHDFMVYRQDAYALTPKKKVLEQIPEVKLKNYAFENKGDLTFKDVSDNWGLDLPTFSNGAVYADLDNDGAMDMIINNIDDEALIYRNTSRDDKKTVNNAHFLQISFKGGKQNINGLGAIVDIYYNHGKHQVYENDPYRGYLSTVQAMAHFGLGKVSLVDSAVIKWPGGKKQKLLNIKADQKIKVSIDDANINYTLSQPEIDFKAYFKEVTDSLGLHYLNKKIDFVDFNIQKLLPHKLSEYSPALAVGDIDGNGLDDLIIGGDNYYPTQVFLQLPNGKFKQRDFLPGKVDPYKHFTDEGLLLFDANGDGKLDLYIASGGYKDEPNTLPYQDRLYLNDGKGNFTLAADALPVNYTSKLCVRACDYNKDGKLDLFISGRVDPWSYPKPVSSIILRNDSKNGHVKFTDVTKEVAPGLKNIGLVCDAIFTDFDNDGWPDLIMAGEWMPVTFFKNEHGKFVNITPQSGIGDKLGWWNSIVAGDFRHTGRMDYIVGNVGQNSLFQANDQYPVYITAGDFDHNGAYDAIPSLYLKDKNGEKQEFPVHGRDDVFKQMISLKKKFTNYKSFAVATMDDILSPEQRKGALRLKANMLKSCFLRNDGNGKFTLIPLPIEAQFSTLNGMQAGDFDGDGNLDVVINGNDYGTDVSIGRYDALNGLMLKGDGKGGFKPLSILQSGIYIPGDGKALVQLRDTRGNIMLAASQHKDSLKVFRLNIHAKTIAVKPTDAYAIIKYKNGKTEKQEFYFGSSFLSQSARFIKLDDNITSIVIFDTQNKSRVGK
ncbi:VCBS repeat protein [Mucilaginibacter frigoritolerans]|uniref:VCBS repeat protein n=1 Tax=Mucilaginibacter frigoritolerans TaxID=652788 RepID=A0A562U887_9SPHI|nr:VCBS repeat-containing protein [Mucilaginibacter frigoritolerans]TWJ01645.1 VCBS repeat protein [Mucilaginibacter frigoritolerans]